MNIFGRSAEAPAVIYIVGDFRQAALILASYIAAVNLVTFILYGIDKRRAVRRRSRISEAILIMMAWLGGAAGALLAMRIFHHKTSKWKFRILVPLAFILWTMGLIWIIIRVQFY